MIEVYGPYGLAASQIAQRKRHLETMKREAERHRRTLAALAK